MTEFEGQVLADLRVLKSQMDQLHGIGQPGRLHLLEQRVTENEQGGEPDEGRRGRVWHGADGGSPGDQLFEWEA